jgi:hypothetical protein
VADRSAGSATVYRARRVGRGVQRSPSMATHYASVGYSRCAHTFHLYCAGLPDWATLSPGVYPRPLPSTHAGSR